MLFTADNQKDFLTNAYVHSLDTRNKNNLYLPVVSLSCVQKGVSYSGIEIFNVFQVLYRVMEMTGKDSKTSYTDTLLSSPFIHC